MVTKTVKCHITLNELDHLSAREQFIRDRLVRMLASEIANVLITNQKSSEHNASHFEASVDISFKDAK